MIGFGKSEILEFEDLFGNKEIVDQGVAGRFLLRPGCRDGSVERLVDRSFELL